ncbi:MAG: hypothetical protein ACTSUF_09695 [Candidatus Heimdallarchaeaceae archaeon]
MEGWKEHIGKKLKVIFDDGQQVSFKIGILTGFNETHLFLRNEKRQTEGINIERVIRFEVLDDDFS